MFSLEPPPNEIIIYFVLSQKNEHFIGVWHQNGFFNNFHLFYVYHWINGLPGCQPFAYFAPLTVNFQSFCFGSSLPLLFMWVGLTDFFGNFFSIFYVIPWK